MKNEYGLDVSYFENKLKLVVRDIARYTPDELHRELSRLAGTAKATITCNHEFLAKWDHSKCVKCGVIYIGNSKSNREDWGVAAGKTFKNMEEAKFYKNNGRLPE